MGKQVEKQTFDYIIVRKIKAIPFQLKLAQTLLFKLAFTKKKAIHKSFTINTSCLS